MRAKSLILLVIALGCGMIAAVGVSKAVMDKGPAQVAEATVEIFVAVKDLPTAEKISAESVKLEKWPKSRVPEGALFDLAQLEDKYTNQMIFASEPILDRKLADSRESFSTAIPPGYRVFDIAGTAGYIKPGDHVDILGTFALGGRNSVPESRTVMRNVQVFGINGLTTRDSDPEKTSGRGGSVFQLLVKESQLEALTLANKMGELRLNLRPFGGDGVEGNDTDNGESFLSWLSDSQKSEPVEPLRQEPVSTVANTMQNLFSGAIASAAAAPSPSHEMLIITPNGMKKYEWSDENKMPREVVDQPGNGSSEGVSAAPATGFSGTSGNVYSGYGGYSPTYPTSATPAGSDTGASAPESGSQESVVN